MAKRKRARASPAKTKMSANSAKSCCSPSEHTRLHYHIKKKGIFMLLFALALVLNYMYAWWPVDHLLALVFGLWGLKKLVMSPPCCR